MLFDGWHTTAPHVYSKHIRSDALFLCVLQKEHNDTHPSFVFTPDLFQLLIFRGYIHTLTGRNSCSLPQNVADYNHFDTVQLSLDNPEIHPGESWAFVTAARHGYTDIVQLLIADGRIDLEHDNNSVIRCAAENGHSENNHRLYFIVKQTNKNQLSWMV